MFHKAIKHNYSQKQLIYSEYLFQAIKNQLRYDLKNSRQVATLIHSYLVLLEKCGFLDKKTVYRKYKHPFAIENKVLPIVDNKQLNAHVALYFSEFNLLAIGWQDYYNAEIFFDEAEQKLLQKSMHYYQNLVLQQMQQPLQIEKGLLEWFQQAVSDQIIELAPYEKEFIDHLSSLVFNDQFISQGVYDTFTALLEEKFR